MEFPWSQRKRDYVDVFDNPKGTAILIDLMRRAFGLRDTGTRNVDPQVLAYMEGQRDLVAYILRQLNRTDAEMLGLIQDGIQSKEGKQ
jgi:hypothetical protein